MGKGIATNQAVENLTKISTIVHKKVRLFDPNNDFLGGLFMVRSDHKLDNTTMLFGGVCEALGLVPVLF